MTFRVIVQSRARRDLIRLGDFLVNDNPRAALAAVDAIEAALRSLVT
ncbi:MAG: type II toxin-antitoxin system RelE/ParE family toxin, partial [Brevundimonas sp.]